MLSGWWTWTKNSSERGSPPEADELLLETVDVVAETETAEPTEVATDAATTAPMVAAVATAAIRALVTEGLTVTWQCSVLKLEEFVVLHKLVQLVVPIFGAYAPASHSMQLVWPVLDWYRPASHNEQLEAPGDE